MPRWRSGQPEWGEAHPRAVRPAIHRHSRRHLLRQQRRALRPRPALRALLGHALGGPDRADHGNRLPAGSPMNVALAVIVAVVALAVGLALRSRRGHDMDLEQWSVGGRGFGAIFVFLLMAGEIYSTFTFLGGAGFAYGSGGAAYYILGYGTLAYVLSYYLLPAVWRFATPRKLVSQADVFTSAFNSRALGVLVSVVAVAAMIPYLALQLKGLGIIVSATSYGSIGSTPAIWMGAVALSVYVAASGIRGSAWTAAIKDVLIASATTVAKNVVRGVNPSLSDGATASLSKLMVPVVALAGVAFVFAGGQTL